MSDEKTSQRVAAIASKGDAKPEISYTGRDSNSRGLGAKSVPKSGRKASRRARLSRPRASRRNNPVFSQTFDRNDAASGYRHDPARLCVERVVEIADALAEHLDVGIVLQEPAYGRAFDGARRRQLRKMPPGRNGLGAVLPADDDQRAMMAASRSCNDLTRES